MCPDRLEVLNRVEREDVLGVEPEASPVAPRRLRLRVLDQIELLERELSEERLASDQPDATLDHPKHCL